MLFSSAAFLFYFLPAFLVAYLVIPSAWRNAMALLGSVVFYAYGAPTFVYVLVASTALDYWLSHGFEGAPAAAKRRLLWMSLVVNVGTLLYAKYANFFVEQTNGFLEDAGMAPMEWTNVVLPIGVSFFTFQKISYVVDVARGNATPARSFGDCLLYVALFPQLIAGPIVRYHDVDLQIRNRVHSSKQFASGVQRFTVGLAKKVILANAMAAIADEVFATPIKQIPTLFAWLGALAYTLQIYFDFSGYSDMAIGLGRMMGFEFLENFDRPYSSKTFTEFWRRWHISLSRWMREYLYIPLGGNRVGPVRQYLNLWIVFLISGFWHGAAWHFLAWGAYQGGFLTADRLFFLRWAERIPAILLRLALVFLVMMSWVLFRAESLEYAWNYWKCMILGGTKPFDGSTLGRKVWFDTRDQFMTVLAVVICVLPWSQRICGAERRLLAWFKSTGLGALTASLLTLVLLAYSVLVLVNSSHNPFIYFRF
ncbi:MAG: MBOAT family protein [Myxococcota bacterium]